VERKRMTYAEKYKPEAVHMKLPEYKFESINYALLWQHIKFSQNSKHI
jgi:hypothetical protein